jgi:hypothetical protein
MGTTIDRFNEIHMIGNNDLVGSAVVKAIGLRVLRVPDKYTLNRAGANLQI